MTKDNKKRTEYSVAIRVKHISDYKSGNFKSAASFALKNDIPYQTFKSWQKADKLGHLKLIDNAENRSRDKDGEYKQVEDLLVQYLHTRMQLYKTDKCGLCFSFLQQKCLDWATTMYSGDQENGL